MSSENAKSTAQRQCGNTANLQESRRGFLILTSLEFLWHEVRVSLRTLGKNWTFSLVSIVTLAVGIGAATAMFSVIDNVLLAPFPYEGARRMVFPLIVGAQQTPEEGRNGYTAAEILEFQRTGDLFNGTAATNEDLILYRHDGGTDQLYGADVTPGTFEFFGMPAFLGRLFEDRDYEAGASPVFLMRYKVWKQRFNADRSILGKSFVFNGTARTLIGIMPPRFAWYDADIYIPTTLVPRAGDPPSWFFLGRLKPGVSDKQAESELTVIATRMAKLHPHDYPEHFTVPIKHLGDGAFDQFKKTLYTVLAAVGLLLLIACSNVANLMLARSTTREKEFAVRGALGAGRARMVRMLIVESLLLAGAGAYLGIALAWGGLKLLVTALPPDFVPAEAVIELNVPVLWFTLAVTVMTALMFGLAPALQISRRNLNSSLRDSGKGINTASKGRWLRDLVVVGEVALSLILLIAAGLLMRSFVTLRQADLGLRADHVFETRLVLPAERYKSVQKVEQFFEALLLRIRTMPGVVEATESSAYPPYAGDLSKIEIDGKSHLEDWQAQFQLASEGYFRVLRVKQKQGRTFTEDDIHNARRLAIVNETFARRYLDNEDPIGRRVRIASLEAGPAVQDAAFQIIGVVGDLVNPVPQAAVQPQIWLPYTVAARGPYVLVVRTTQDPATIVDSIRTQVWAVDSGVALAYPETLERLIGQIILAGPRFGFVMMAIFGSIGLILVTVGVYSVLAYSTATRTQEIGIRMALGASRGDVLRMVVVSGLRLVVTGLAIGVAISLLLGKFIQTELVGVSTYDPVTIGAMTLLLTITGIVACCLPARRAANVDPMIALRER